MDQSTWKQAVAVFCLSFPLITSVSIFQCRIRPFPRWTSVFSATDSSWASKSESISPSSIYVFMCSPSFHIPYFSIFCLITPGWRFREACGTMEVTAAYAMTMTCAAYHTIYSVCVCVCGQLQGKTLTHTHTYTGPSCIWRPSSLSSYPQSTVGDM